MKNRRPKSVTIRSNLKHVNVRVVLSLVQNGLRVWLWSHSKVSLSTSRYPWPKPTRVVECPKKGKRAGKGLENPVPA